MSMISELMRPTGTTTCAVCGVQIPARAALHLDGESFCSVLHEVEFAAQSHVTR